MLLEHHEKQHIISISSTYHQHIMIHHDTPEYFELAKVPFLFTEFGCNLGAFRTKCPWLGSRLPNIDHHLRPVPTDSDRLRYPGGRTWPEVKHLMGKDMGEMMSGAFDATVSTIWL